MKATITTLSPVHIGSGTTYNKNIDFIQVENEIGVIDENKVLKIIGEDNINQWVDAINRGGDAFINLLRQRGWQKDLKQISSRISELKSSNNQSSQLKEQYRTSVKGACIPGSSLKGSLKTAIFNLIINEQFLKGLKINDLKNKKGKWDFYENIDKKIFGSTANEKLTRFLKVSDMHFENIDTQIYELGVLNAYGSEGKDWKLKPNETFLIEAIPTDVKAEFDFNINIKLLEENIKDLNKKNIKHNLNFFIDNDIPTLCAKINLFTRKMLANEYNDLKNYNFEQTGINMFENYTKIFNKTDNCKENEMIIRVGAGSGYNFMTGKWVENEHCLSLWTDEEGYMNEDFENLRKTVQKKDYTNMETWPKTRKISTNGEIFGFVKLTLK